MAFANGMTPVASGSLRACGLTFEIDSAWEEFLTDDFPLMGDETQQSFGMESDVASHAPGFATGFVGDDDEMAKGLGNALQSYLDSTPGQNSQPPTFVSPKEVLLSSGSTEYLTTPELEDMSAPATGHLSTNQTPLFPLNNSFGNSQGSQQAALFPTLDNSAPTNNGYPIGYEQAPGPTAPTMVRQESNTSAKSAKSAKYTPAQKTGVHKTTAAKATATKVPPPKKGRKRTQELATLDPDDPSLTAEERKKIKNTIAARESRWRRDARETAAEEKASYFSDKSNKLLRYMKAMGIPIPHDVNPEEEVEMPVEEEAAGGEGEEVVALE